MSIRDNIIKLRDIYDVTQEQLGEIAGVTRGAVSQWEGGFSEPRMGAIQRMADHFRISKSNIIEDGGMDLIDPITRKGRSHPSGSMPVRGMEMGYVPLRGRVHMGTPVEPEVYDEEMVLAPQFLIDDDPDLYACTSEGDCMNRVYPEGCIIFISPNKPPQNGSVAVVTINGVDTVMRRMFRTADTLVLSPDSFNPENRDIVIMADDGKSVEFNGKVVWYQPTEEME